MRRFIRYELEKLFNEGYTQNQMEGFIRLRLVDWETTTKDIIEDLVESRWQELVLRKHQEEKPLTPNQKEKWDQ